MPHLVELVRSRAIEIDSILTQVELLTGVLEAYKAFDQRQPGWMKVELIPQSRAAVMRKWRIFSSLEGTDPKSPAHVAPYLDRVRPHCRSVIAPDFAEVYGL